MSPLFREAPVTPAASMMVVVVSFFFFETNLLSKLMKSGGKKGFEGWVGLENKNYDKRLN